MKDNAGPDKLLGMKPKLTHAGPYYYFSFFQKWQNWQLYFWITEFCVVRVMRGPRRIRVVTAEPFALAKALYESGSDPYPLTDMMMEMFPDAADRMKLYLEADHES